MREPKAGRTPDGDIVLHHLPPLLRDVILQLPALIADDAPGVEDRLFPDAYGGEGMESEEWRRLAVPELRHLFASARALVTSDLAGLTRERNLAPSWRLTIPGPHLQAWLSSLAAARVALGGAHDLDAAAMDRPLPVRIADRKDRAVILIHMLGWIQGMLVEAAG